MIEAMACGTPVIAFRCGSVPEVIDDYVAGFIINDEAEAVAAIGRIGELASEAFERPDGSMPATASPSLRALAIVLNVVPVMTLLLDARSAEAPNQCFS